MARRRLFPVSLGAALAMATLAACVGGGGGSSPPPATCRGATSVAATASEQPLSRDQARELARMVEAQAEPADNVPLVTIEWTTGGPRTTVTPVDDQDEAARVAESAAAGNDLVGIEVDSPVRASVEPLRSQQWALDNVLFETASSATSGGAGQIVAVVDTGVDATHEDLTGQVLLPGRHFLSSGDGVGAADDNGHGTHVAGILAASENGKGILGAAPSVDILPVKVLDANGTGLNSDTADGITWAVDNGADVISMSLGGGYSQAVDDAVLYARQNGVVVVAAAGNQGQGPNPTYPGALPLAIGVGATTSSDTIASYSNKNACVDVAAPGDQILSTFLTSKDTTDGNQDGYTKLNGTSMATPYASAAIALILAAHPSYTAVEACTQLIRTAEDLGAAGKDTSFGNGLIQPDVGVGPTDTSGPSCV